MKKLFTLTPLLVLLAGMAIGQNPDDNSGVPWSIHVDEELAGAIVEGYIEYKDADGAVIYTEEFDGLIDGYGFVQFIIGSSFINPLPIEKYKDVRKLCWELTFPDVGSGVQLSGMQDVLAVPRANVAAHAVNSEKISNNTFSNNTVTPSDFVMMQPEEIKSALVQVAGPEGSRIDRLDVTDFIRCDKAISPVSGEEIDVLRIGSGQLKPIVFGAETPGELNHFYTICGLLEDFNHVLTVKGLEVSDLHRPRTASHNTAAIFADNSANVQSAGVLATAQTWGLYGSGQNGAVGISTGSGNGAALWGSISQPPGSGGFKYALYGTSMSHAGSWAAALFGNGFYTGTWSMSSDARLKTEVRTQTNALARVMQLRPAQYRYRQDTPYALPDGIHHGFLAQELEEVFPELVSDITMPIDPDPQTMHTSDVTQYKAVNYIEMITILTSALQELNTTLNAKIDLQAREIEALRAQLK